MALLTVQKIQLNTSLTPTYASAEVGGDTFVNNGRTFLHIKNGSASPIVATIDSLANCNQDQNHDITVTIPAGSEEMVGPFGPGRFNNSSRQTSVSYDDVTSLEIAAIALDS